ncbi:unnamed protein product [Soboliphyme baturini]|uniref:ANK_REP_REGION domain-containing protein n=1 Tax=Soboliphyme baturini TaxID=241478 RepID=A0A183J8T9_9BILA|nr:unnamed protein product [Soboliphyme baturini]
MKTGTSVDVQMKDGTTPLQLAVILENNAAALRLLNAGADPERKTSKRPKSTERAGSDAEANDHVKSAVDFAQGNELVLQLLQGKRDEGSSQGTPMNASAEYQPMLEQNLQPPDVQQPSTSTRSAPQVAGDETSIKNATNLQCQHMIEFLEACSGADQSSPTILFLDQYEQMPQAAVSSLVLALRHMGKHDAASLLLNA